LIAKNRNEQLTVRTVVQTHRQVYLYCAFQPYYTMFTYLPSLQAQRQQ